MTDRTFALLAAQQEDIDTLGSDLEIAHRLLREWLKQAAPCLENPCAGDTSCKCGGGEPCGKCLACRTRAELA